MRSRNFYRGKTVTILIGHPAGGSYDLYARLAAAQLGRFIPGHPQILVQSRPGGSGAGAVQFLYAFGPRDGTLLGLLTETVGLIQLTQPEIGKWRVQDFAYLGSFANVNAAFIMRKDAPAKSVEDMRHIETKVGCNSRLGQTYVNYAVLKAYGGFKFQIVCGYPGSMEFAMVLTRGEVDAISGAWNGWRRRPEVLDGTLRPVIQSGLKRHQELADVPLMQELLDNPKHKQVAEFLSSASTIGRALLVHKAVPAERIAALREAFDQMVKDPSFIMQAERAGAELDPTPGIEIQKVSDAIVATPKEIVDLAAAAQN
jgi:tripartite-type tricarboxylate transporter receptor subunit TctC